MELLQGHLSRSNHKCNFLSFRQKVTENKWNVSGVISDQWKQKSVKQTWDHRRGVWEETTEREREREKRYRCEATREDVNMRWQTEANERSEAFAEDIEDRRHAE